MRRAGIVFSIALSAAIIVLVVAIGGCTSSRGPAQPPGTGSAETSATSPGVARPPLTGPVQARATVRYERPKGKVLTYVLSVPAPRLVAGSDSTVTVAVTNPRDRWVTSRDYYRMTMTDSFGRVVMDTYPPVWRSGLIGVPIGAKKTLRHSVSFVVPLPGSYTVALPDVVDPDTGKPLAVQFESVMPASVPEASGVQGTSMIEGGGSAGPSPATPRPFPGVIAVHEADLSGRIVAKVRADSTGAFKVDLVPGTYTLRQMMSGPPRTVTVRPGQYVTVALLIQAF